MKLRLVQIAGHSVCFLQMRRRFRWKYAILRDGEIFPVPRYTFATTWTSISFALSEIGANKKKPEITYKTKGFSV